MTMRTVWHVLKKELLETLRDRRTLAASVFIPITLMPLMIEGFVYLFQRSTPTYRVAISAQSEPASLLRGVLEGPGVRLVPHEEGALEKGAVQAIVQAKNSAIDSTLDLQLLHTSAPDSVQAVRVVEALLDKWAKKEARERLQALQMNPSLVEPVRMTLRQVDSGGPSHMASILFPLIVLLWTSVGAMYPAADVTCGEKERCTLEALLVTPVGRTQLLVGKFLAVYVISAATLALATTSTVVALQVSNIRRLQVDWSLGGPAGNLALLLQAALTVAVISALEMLASAYARSFREAQSYLTPIFIALLVPGAVLAAAPHLAENELLHYIPLMNNVLSFRELLLGTVDTTHVKLTVLTSLGISGGTLFLIGRLFEQEAILTRTR